MARARKAEGSSLRALLRVDPGSKVDLAQLRLRGDVRAGQGEGGRRDRGRPGAPRPTSTTGSGRRRSTPSSSSSRASTRPARTARSTRSWARSTRRARRSPRSRSRRRWSLPTTTCGGSTRGCPARARSASSTAPTTRTSSSCACTAWSRRSAGSSRYRQINDWERMLTEEGLTIVKFFLAIDRDEQRARFQERVDDPKKRWKFSLGRPRGAQALGRLPGRLRGMPGGDVHAVGALAPHPGEPELAPQPGRRPRSWPTRSRTSTRSTRRPQPGVEGTIVE